MLNISPKLARNRDFVTALAGRSASQFGDELALVALTLRLQASGAHPYQVALLLAAGLLPFVLLARVAGRVADSADSRRVLVCATVAQAGCCIPLIFTGNAVVITVLVALLGAGAAFAQATWQALIPRVVGEDNIAAATSAQQSVFTIATITAPAAAGLLSGAFGTGLPLTIDAVTFGVLTVATMAVRTRRAGIPRAAAKRERGGWAVLRADRILAPLVAGLAAFVLLAMMVNVVTVFLVRQTLAAGAGWYGLLEATWMVGVVAGSLAAGRIPTDARRAQAVVAGAALMSLIFAGYGLAPAVAVLVPLSIIGGVGNGLVNVCVATLVMTRTAERARGRVSAALGGVANGAGVISLALGGGLAVVLDPRQVFLLAAVLGGIVTVVTAVRVSADPGRPVRRWSATRAFEQEQQRAVARYFVRR
jgi:MFS family permease